MDYHGTDEEDILDQAILGLPSASTIYGGAGNDKITLSGGTALGEAGNDTIVSTGTYVTAAYWGSPSSITVDLQVGTAQDGYGSTDTLNGIHNVHASRFNDTLLGSNVEDKFWASTGDDYIDGRGGVDTVSFFFSQSTKFDIDYDATNDLVIVKNSDPTDANFGTKTLKNVEILQFDDVSILTSSLNPNYKITLSPTQSVIISIAGTWTPVNATSPTSHQGVAIANVYYSAILLPDGRAGIVMNGWSWDGQSNSIQNTVSAAIFEQNADGTMSNVTSKWLPDAVTNGSGSVVVADFNGDGISDIFLASYNESPQIAQPSTVYLSNASSSFQKITLHDEQMAHDAKVTYINGIPTIFTADYGGFGSDADPSYQYRSGQFVETKYSPGAVNNVMGCTIAFADFLGNGTVDAVFGDCNYGPGYSDLQHNQSLIAIYKLSDVENNSGAPLALLTPYFNDKPQYANISSMNGLGQTHTYRVWVDDFNHDAKPDIIAGGSMWNGYAETQNLSMLQLLQNASVNGAISFVDKTDTLNIDYNVYTAEVDYSMQLIDVDHSGINTYLIAGGINAVSNPIQDNYILLNDGTGKLHVYMHDQFQVVGEQVNVYLGIANGAQPRFIEYQTANGNINLEAEVQISVVINGNTVSQQEFVNVPLQLNPTVDYTDNTTIADRNGSMLMRTWAGNDTICDNNANSSPASIDGGLGVDTSWYSYTRSKYQITHNSDGTWGVTQSGTIADTLKNIERIKFSDKKIALDLSPTEHAGQALEFIGELAPALVNNPSIVGLILGLFDQGSSLHDVCQLALNVGLVSSIAGSSSNQALAAMVFRNLIGTEANSATLDVLVSFMDGRSASYSQADFMTVIAGLELNQTHINLVGLQQTGIEYT